MTIRAFGVFEEEEVEVFDTSYHDTETDTPIVLVARAGEDPSEWRYTPSEYVTDIRAEV